MSVLVYALHRSLGGFQVLPAAHTSLNYPYDLISATPLGIAQPEAEEVNAQTIFDFMKCIDLPTVNYSDLPAKIRANVLAVLQDPRRLGTKMTSSSSSSGVSMPVQLTTSSEMRGQIKH